MKKICALGLECALMQQQAGLTAERCPNWQCCGGHREISDAELEALGIKYTLGNCVWQPFVGSDPEREYRFRLSWEQGIRLATARGETLAIDREMVEPVRQFVLVVIDRVYAVALMSENGTGWEWEF